MIISLITTVFVGILIIVLGAVNMTGNISSLHSYHRHRVKEEDKKPFGRLVGFGLIICGIATIILGIFMFFAEKYMLAVTLGMTIFGILFAIGLGITFYAMIKYNKGIF